MVKVDYTQFVESNIRTVWLKDWTVKFLQGLRNESGKDAIEKYCLAKKAEFETICQEKSSARFKTETRVNTGVGWQNSAASYMSQMRKAITAWCDYKSKKGQIPETDTYPQATTQGNVQQHYALLFMNYHQGFHQERMAPTNAKKEAQRGNLEQIASIDKYLAKIDELLQSRDYRELAAGLIAATGRRPAEILVTAEFKQLNQYQVEFTGQVKTKSDQPKTYPTYTLVESYKVVNALARLRRIPEVKLLTTHSLLEVDSATNNKINSKVKESFSEIIKPPSGESTLSAKNLRAVYGAIAIHFFCPIKQSTNQFMTQNLGHVSEATATNYEDYQVTDEEGQPLGKGILIERLKEEMIEATEAVIVQPRVSMTLDSQNHLDDTEFLPFPDRPSRMDELIRLAKIGKEFEQGKLVNQVMVVQHKPDIEVSEENLANMKAQLKIKSLSQWSNKDLFNSKVRHGGVEKMRRAVDAIKLYNEQQAEFKYHWAINTKTLKDLTGCSTEIVESYLKSDEGRLNAIDYNLEKGYTFHQNRGKGTIRDFIKLTDAEEN
ncbi:MAG: hypothetical protein HWQ41_00480 [Nostoc sp. NOS(2021)]|uniref:protelomerase family protein n=1 Tax=Nostoc sp. NOS(2021) TaxID=2815407 RepID=UPI0025E0F9C3|nr:protelomerase family protein [Nostoc sp. NOS(2021)]MBN3893820.1 hypothetical protein [Nostoc sp. NOS(2021)]